MARCCRKGMAAWMKKYYPGRRCHRLVQCFRVYARAADGSRIPAVRRRLDSRQGDEGGNQPEGLGLADVASGDYINTSPTDYVPVKHLQLMRFDGRQWTSFGELSGR